MELGPRGTTLILDYEKFRSKPYRDQKGVWTIGFGTISINGSPVTANTPPCTPDQALGWFKKDSQVKTAAVNKLVTTPLTQNQFDSLVSFVYNVGEGGFESSSLLRAINARQPISEDLFTRWNKVRINGVLVTSLGLTRRRLSEYHLFTAP